MKKTSSLVRKFSVENTKKGLLKSASLMAGLFVGGLLEKHVLSNVAFLSDTKAVSATDPTLTKNTVGVMLKSAIYVVAGLIPAQLTNNELLAFTGYGVTAYGGLKAAKSLTESAKVFGLGGIAPHIEPTYFPTYPTSPTTSLTSK
jgi:hypothetical protein